MKIDRYILIKAGVVCMLVGLTSALVLSLAPDKNELIHTIKGFGNTIITLTGYVLFVTGTSIKEEPYE